MMIHCSFMQKTRKAVVKIDSDRKALTVFFLVGVQSSLSCDQTDNRNLFHRNMVAFMTAFLLV